MVPGTTSRQVEDMTAPPCWCCASWGIYAEGTEQDQGAKPSRLCFRCSNSSPSACNKRHAAEAAEAENIREDTPNDQVR